MQTLSSGSSRVSRRRASTGGRRRVMALLEPTAALCGALLLLLGLGSADALTCKKYAATFGSVDLSSPPEKCSCAGGTVASCGAATLDGSAPACWIELECIGADSAVRCFSGTHAPALATTRPAHTVHTAMATETLQHGCLPELAS